MSLPKIVKPSVSEIMERIRRKAQEEFIALHPAIKEQIEHLKEAKRWGSRKNADDDYKTIIHVDLTNAIRTGVLVQAEELIGGNCLEGVINGLTADGIKISVTVRLMDDADDPLVMMSFAFLSDETDIGN